MNLRSYTVATPGQALTPEQAQILVRHDWQSEFFGGC